MIFHHRYRLLGDQKKADTDQIGRFLYSGAKTVFSQPPIVQVLPLKKMRPVIFLISTLQL